MDSLLPRKTINSRRAVVTNLTQGIRVPMTRGPRHGAYLQVAPSVKEEILGLEVAVCDALRVEIAHAGEDLLEAALYFGRGHPTLLDSSV